MASLLATAPLFHAIMKQRSGGVVVAGAIGVVVVGEHGVAAYALAPHGRGRGRGGAPLRLRRHRDASLSLSLSEDFFLVPLSLFAGAVESVSAHGTKTTRGRLRQVLDSSGLRPGGSQIGRAHV